MTIITLAITVAILVVLTGLLFGLHMYLEHFVATKSNKLSWSTFSAVVWLLMVASFCCAFVGSLKIINLGL